MSTNANCCLDTCFLHCDGVPSCIRFIKLATTIVTGSVTVTITDKFGHVYYLTASTDENGFALLDLESVHLPVNLLNPYAGFFDLRVPLMRFPAEDTYFECLRFDVKQTYAVAADEPDPDDLNTYPTYEMPYVYEPL